MTKEQQRRELRKKGYIQIWDGSFLAPKEKKSYDTLSSHSNGFRSEKNAYKGCDYSRIP